VQAFRPACCGLADAGSCPRSPPRTRGTAAHRCSTPNAMLTAQASARRRAPVRGHPLGGQSAYSANDACATPELRPTRPARCSALALPRLPGVRVATQGRGSVLLPGLLGDPLEDSFTRARELERQVFRHNLKIDIGFHEGATARTHPMWLPCGIAERGGRL
jgi:hypothetical protein